MNKRRGQAHSLGDADPFAPYRRSAVSALDGWIDVCRAGTWRDVNGREVTIDEPRLDRIVAAHSTADPAPAVVGHPATDAPAFAWVDGLRRVGDRLQARFERIAPAFREAVEAGRYSGRSIALQGDTIRHIGFLGGRPPAVPGLAPTHFAAEAETVVALAAFALGGEEERWGWRAVERVMRSLRERIIATDGEEAADRTIPDYEIETVASVARTPEAQPTMAAPAALESPVSDPDNDPKEDPVSEENDAAALAAREASLDAREAALAVQERLRGAEKALQPHVEAGRVLPAERAGLAALFASLPDGDDATIAFAAPPGSSPGAGSGDGEVREKPAAILERFLAALPKRVAYDTLAGGPVPGARAQGEDSAGIANEARALMADQAHKGIVLSAEAAVDQVRAKRGLPIGGGA